MMHPHIAARLFNTPLLVHPGKAAAILAGLGGRVAGNGVKLTGNVAVLDHRATRGLGVIGDELGREADARSYKTYDMVDGIAVIAVEGSLIHKGAWIGAESGETSYQGLQTQVARAMNDDAVKGVVFEIDSCGGEVSGAFDTSDMIFALTQAKPTLAILTDTALSAGYLMASACGEIVIPETGTAGSIGVICIHTDMSAALADEGVSVTILKAGAHKADGNPFEPLPVDAASRIMADLQVTRQVFAGRVARYRGSRLTLESALATEALEYSGVLAVDAGLADWVGSPSAAFSLFRSELNRA